MIGRVLKFSAGWCAPCKAYAKTFHEVSEDERFKGVSFEEIDIDENDELVEKYRIMSVPTTIVLDDNDSFICMKTGNLPKSILEEMLTGKE